MFISHESIDDYLPRWPGEGLDADILKIAEALNLTGKRASLQSSPSWITH